MSTSLTDIDIARSARLDPIADIGAKLGLAPGDLVPYGDHKAKVKMSAIRRLLDSDGCRGRLILVSAITPTPAGEGKTTVSIGLSQALQHIGKKTAVAVREPSLGPVFGVKGGAAGGGYSQVLPMEDINLHFTGDFHAVTTAHNLIAAALDNQLHFDNARRIDARTLSWRRCLDMNDRALRDIVIGLGGKLNSVPRETGFDITASSEIMAILCLSTSYAELKEKVGRITLGYTPEGEAVLARDLNVQGAVTALLKDALLPNLVQTIEHVPAFVHGGPFANIAQGANSILATKLALKTADFVVTEAGFGFDLGAEKFFDIVCPYGGFHPCSVVLVATVRALKMHGGVPKSELGKADPDAVLRGRGNLEKHVENMHKFKVNPVVAVNRFHSDTPEELEAIRAICREAAVECSVVDFWGQGGKGGVELAEKLTSFPCRPGCMRPYQPLYDWALPVEEKVLTIAREIYGAAAVDYLPKAKANLKTIKRLGHDKLPVCIAKTQNSLSDNPELLGRPKDFLVTVREVVLSSGAGFLVPITGEIMRMPGLPKTSSFEKIDVDPDGNITGLF
ncbi:MAG: formate--tetrahydrofolate ligase [Acidobacteria bacterium]|nr:formate--tetrahydrofolate ligase [Acidobacteriota bacterium]